MAASQTLRSMVKAGGMEAARDTFNDILYGGPDAPEKEWKALPYWIEVKITAPPRGLAGLMPTKCGWLGRDETNHYRCEMVWRPDEPGWLCMEEHDPDDPRFKTFVLTPKRDVACDGISNAGMMERFKTVMNTRQPIDGVFTTATWGQEIVPLADSREREEQQLEHFLETLKVPMEVLFCNGVVVWIEPGTNQDLGEWTNIDEDNLQLLRPHY